MRVHSKGNEAPHIAPQQRPVADCTFDRANGSLVHCSGSDSRPTISQDFSAKIPLSIGVGTAVTLVLVTVFCLACIWEFRAEAYFCQLFGLPYDAVGEAEDSWRFVWMETAFAAISLILPTIAIARTFRLLKSALAKTTALQVEAMAASSAKTRFLANMSHELRTPLNAIIGFSELTKEQTFGPLNERYRGYAADIHQSGVHLLTVINDVLDLTKLETNRLTLNIEEIDLPGNIASVLHILTPLCEKAQLKMCLEISGTLPAILTDAVRLKQILLNLLSNAIKFTPRGGLITLSVSPISGFVAITIADTGIGIASENLERVVQPFFQVDAELNRAHEGTGLGLAITAQLIELMGGRFNLTSELGAGTRATVCLPCAIEETAAA
jgi:signal transduction histidine kinase